MLSDLAERACTNYHSIKAEQEVAFVVDPATVALMTDLIVAITKLWQACNKTPEEATDEANDPTELERKIVENVVRKKLWFWQYWSYGEKVVDALMETGLGLEAEEVEQLYQEIQQNVSRK